MVNPFDKQALAARLAVREQALAEPQALKVGLKLAKGETPAEEKTIEAFLARRKENRR